MIKDKIRFIDIKAIFLLGLLYVPALFFRLFNRNIWLCSERKDEARDNGYWMYKYIRENYSKQKCYYVITKTSIDRKKIEKYKTLITWGSLKHYFIFMAAKIRLSAHVDTDTPNSRVTNFMEKHHLLRNKRVFLQHGITKDKISFGYFNVNRADLFICGAIPEYEFCKNTFGHPEKNYVLTGFARFDGLNNNNVKKQILVIPTWRVWLNNVTEEEFKNSQYFKTYHSLINNCQLLNCLERNHYRLLFFMHSEMQKFIHLFASNNEYLIIGDEKAYDVQALLNESNILVTDYSSVAFDFAYLRKPVVYYHFDYEKYRKYQHPKGYFSYRDDGFGPVMIKENDVINFISETIANDANNEVKYEEKVNTFFKFFDKNNCSRIYYEIKKI